MLRLLLLFLLFVSCLYADPSVKITSSSTNLNAFKLSYYIDTTTKMSLDEVRQQKFLPAANRLTLGVDADVTWLKIKLQNETNTTQKLYIHDVDTYLSTATAYYEIDHDQLTQSIQYKPVTLFNTDKLDGAMSRFLVVLPAFAEKEVYICSNFSAFQLIDLGIYDEAHSTQKLVHQYVPTVVLVTILSTLALYYLILSLVSGHKEYIYYTLYLFSSSLFVAYSYGMLSHYFHVYGTLALRLNSLIIVPPIFLALFAKAIFETKHLYPKENFFLNTIIFMFTLTYGYSFFSYYDAIELTSLLYIYYLTIMLVVALSLLIKGNKLVVYFLAAHLFYLYFSVVAILFYNNLIAFSDLSSYAAALGTLSEALLLGFLVSYRIKLLEDENHQQEALIVTDALTTLYNKRHFNKTFKRELLIQKRAKNDLILMILDIDFFKQYNDHYGHLAGDKALKQVAQSLKDSLHRSSDMAFRIGGEEFAVLISSASEDQAERFANRLRENIQDREIMHLKSSVSSFITVSIGVYVVNPHSQYSVDEIYMLADHALYTAKENGRNCVVVSKG